MSERRLRIIHCFRSPVGGIFRHVRDLAEAQAKAGHMVGIVCDSSTGGAHEERLFEDASKWLALGVSRTAMQRHIGPGDIASAWRTYKLLKSLNPDILHGHGAKGGTYARLFGTFMRRSSRVARIYSLHGGTLHYDADTVTGKLFFGIERAMERVTDRLLFVSDYERQTYRQKIGEPAVANELVYNGLRAPEFEQVLPHNDAADFLYIGMMRDLKGPDIFIDAFARAQAESRRRLTAFMVGDGDQIPDYKAQIQRLGLSDQISFRPAMPARQAFALARTIVVPSRAEAMPYIVLEALAAGMPMIATAVGGIPEIFQGHEEALASATPDAIALRMKEALHDPLGFLNRMPTLDALRRRFSVETMAADIERVYTSSLAEA